jgi:hypothetical protein
MANDVLVEEILAGLTAYAQQYGLPESSTQVSAIIGSLLNVKTQGMGPPLTPRQIDRVLQQVRSGFNPMTVATAGLDPSQQALATQAHRWRQDLEQQVTGVLDAYLQRYAPGATTDSLAEMVTAVAPMVNKGRATKPEVLGLVQHLADTLAPGATLAAGLDPTYLSLAKDLATVVSQRQTTAAVAETVTAYVETFSPAAAEIGESLIENALGAILKNKVQFGIDTDLSLADKRLLIQQVSFQLNIMEQSPLPSKSAQAMAAELKGEIERFQAQRRGQAGDLDVTAGHLSQDGLSIASSWVFTDSDRPEEAIEDSGFGQS